MVEHLNTYHETQRSNPHELYRKTSKLWHNVMKLFLRPFVISQSVPDKPFQSSLMFPNIARAYQSTLLVLHTWVGSWPYTQT